MKKAIIITALAAMLTACSCSAPHQFSDLNDVNGLTQVYTSSALLQLSGSIVSKISGINFKKALKNAASVRVIVAENKSASNKARSVVAYQIKQLKAIPLIETSGAMTGKGSSGIFVTPTGPDTFSNVVIVTDLNHKFNAVFLEGRISLADIKAMEED